MAAPRVSVERVRPIVLVLLVCLGLYLARHSNGSAAMHWMLIYAPSDFPTLASMVTFFADLRIPIPPVLGALEIWNYQLTGTTDFVTIYLYRVGFFGAYVIAVYLASSSLLRLGISTAMSLILLSGAVLVHRGNPQIYDVLFPFFILLFVLCIRLASDRRQPIEPEASAGGNTLLILCLAGGFFLSMAELSRSIMFILMPLAIVWGILSLGRVDRRYKVAFLVPVLLLSGSWHVYILGAHGQLTSGNHSGFNLRLTKMFPEGFAPPLEVAEETRVKPGRWPNLNTEIHGANSRKLERAVFEYMLSHPIDGGARVLRAVGALVATPIVIHMNNPGRERHGALRSAFLTTYRAVSMAGAAFLLANALRLAYYLLTPRGELAALLADPEHFLIALGVLLILLLSVGAGVEQGRIVLSILPFYAALPRARRLKGVP
jgi:hypothetical protein